MSKSSKMSRSWGGVYAFFIFLSIVLKKKMTKIPKMIIVLL